MDNTDLLVLAQNSKELVTGSLLPFLVLYLTRLNWKAEHKFALSIAVSGITAALVAFADGKLTGTTLAENLAVIMTTSQTVYMLFFKGLGLEAWLLPQAAVVDKATQEVKEELSTLSREDAVKILDSSTPDKVEVTIEKS